MEKGRVVVMVITAGLLVAGCRGAGQSGAAQPRLELATRRHDFGRMVAGEHGRTEFRLRNAGRAPLRIAKVDAECGCVAPSYPALLPPGGEGEILIRFDPLVTWGGRVEKTLHLRSNDPSQPVVPLTLAAEIVPLIVFEPRSPVDVPYEWGQTLEREVMITPKPDAGIRVTRVSTESGQLKVALEPLAAAAQSPRYRLRLKVGPCERSGDFPLHVRVYTNHPDMPQILYEI